MGLTLTSRAPTSPLDIAVVSDDSTTNPSYFSGRIKSTDASTKASGTSYALRVEVTASGTKTGGNVRALGAKITVSGATSSATAFHIYTAVGAFVTDSVRGIEMYMDTCTTAPSSIFYGIDIGIVGTGLSTVGSFIRMYNHGTAAMNSVFMLDNAAQDIATYLFTFGAGAQLPLSDYSSGTTVQQRIACNVGGGALYLHLFTS